MKSDSPVEIHIVFWKLLTLFVSMRSIELGLSIFLKQEGSELNLIAHNH